MSWRYDKQLEQIYLDDDVAELARESFVVDLEPSFEPKLCSVLHQIHLGSLKANFELFSIVISPRSGAAVSVKSQLHLRRRKCHSMNLLGGSKAGKNRPETSGN